MKGNKSPNLISSKKNSRMVVFIMQDDILEDDSIKTIDLIKLRHPKTGIGAYFAVSNKKIQEVLKFSEDKRSFFIDEFVVSNGEIYLSTPVDPLFLLLPYLKKAKHCSPLDHILVDEEYPEIATLSNCDRIGEINYIADKRGDESLNAYLYNETKTLEWLQRKLKRIAEVLKSKGIHVSRNKATSANFVNTERTQDSAESYLRFALGLLGEYLDTEMMGKLSTFVGLSTEKMRCEVACDDQNDETNESPQYKKIKLDEQSSITVNSLIKIDKTVKHKAKEQALAKAAKGTKSISSFFKRK